jgi:anti-sigma regulatory factor (Ser/Thr protein kinase)
MADHTDSDSDHHDPQAELDDPHAELIELELPLHHRHASTVRVVAASLGADAGFTVDEIEDLRLGVNEAVSVLADVDDADGARLRLRFAVSGQTMTVTATRTGVDRVVKIDDVDELAVRILRAVVDDFRVDDGGFVVVKRAVASDGD